MNHFKLEIPTGGEYFFKVFKTGFRSWYTWGLSKRELNSLGTYNGCNNYELISDLPLDKLRNIIAKYLDITRISDFKVKYQGTYDHTKEDDAIEAYEYDRGACRFE
jgi:hypothetical protein